MPAHPKRSGPSAYVLRSAYRWRDCPPEYGPSTTIYNRYNRWSAQRLWCGLFECLAAAGNIPDELSIDSTHIKAHRSAAGPKRGSRAGDRPLTWRTRQQDPRSGQCARQPIAFVLTPGNVADITVAATLLDDIAPPCCLLVDKAYDADHFRQRPQDLGAEVVIPSKSSARSAV